MAEALKKMVKGSTPERVMPMVVGGVLAGAAICYGVDWLYFKSGAPIVPSFPELGAAVIVLIAVVVRFRT